MVQKYIAVLLVLTTLGLTSPCLAGDFANLTPLLQTRLANLTPPRATLGSLTGGLAFAPPQSGQPSQPGQPQAQAAPSGSGGMSTKGKVFTWVGVGLIAEGGFDAAYGAAILKDPCSGVSGPYVTCTSN